MKNRPTVNNAIQSSEPATIAGRDNSAVRKARRDVSPFRTSDMRRAYKAVVASGGSITRVSIDPNGRIEFTLRTAGLSDEEELDLVEMAMKNG